VSRALWLGLALFLLPGARAAGPRERPGDGLLAVTLNLWHDQHDWPARRTVILDSLRALRPDVILLEEVLEKEGLPNQAQALAESLGCAFVFASVDSPGAPKRYGNAILTRHRILASGEVRLEPLGDYRVAAHARLDVRGRELDVYVTHLHHTEAGGAIRAEQVRHLLRFIEQTRGRGALVLGGDFNAAPDAPELRPLFARLADAYAALHPGPAGAAVTTLNPAMGHAPRRIDHILTARRGPLRPVAAEVFLDAPTTAGVWASDHFGVWARFRWTR
jgi:endonuclease/exonuclease/phosphatase family metal-dependent hydrolase